MIELMMINHDQDGDDNDENLFGCKVDEEREKEDHEAVDEKIVRIQPSMTNQFIICSIVQSSMTDDHCQ